MPQQRWRQWHSRLLLRPKNSISTPAQTTTHRCHPNTPCPLPTLYRSFSSAGWFCRLGRRADSRPVSVLMLREQCTRYTPAGRGQREVGRWMEWTKVLQPAASQAEVQPTASLHSHHLAVHMLSRPAQPQSLPPRTAGVWLGDVVRLERHDEVGEQGVDGGGVHQRVHGVARPQALPHRRVEWRQQGG